MLMYVFVCVSTYSCVYIYPPLPSRDYMPEQDLLAQNVALWINHKAAWYPLFFFLIYSESSTGEFS